ncbi:MAG: zinc-ribbon domain-containing protein [Ruminococcus sp.]|nr:zinc-ribbon domain-containing protein [Ruminococcus sp.]
MAFCMKCGKEFPDGANFCPACGTKKDDTPNTPNTNVTPKKQRKPLGTGGIVAIVAGVALVLVILIGFVIWGIVDAYYDNKYEYEYFYSQFDEEAFDNDIVPDDYDIDADIDNGKDDSDKDPLDIMCDYAGDIVEDITEKANYLPYGLQESCAVLTDADADGIYELYVVYNQKIDGVIHAKAEIWSLEPDNKQLLLSDTLYTEVGGNTGTLGVYAYSGEIFVGVEKSRPDGSGFNDSSVFTPLSTLGNLKPDTEEFTTSGSYATDSKAVYKIDSKAVSKADYETRYNAYYKLFSIPDNANNSAMVMTIDEFLTFYGD